MILDVVNFCPVCGAPIYGSKQVEGAHGGQHKLAITPALVTFSCDCRRHLVFRLELENAKLAAESRRAAEPRAGG